MRAPNWLGACASLKHQTLGPFVLTLPAIVGIVLLFVAPFFTFAVYSVLTAGILPFQADVPVTLEAYKHFLSAGVNRTLARNSAWTGFFAAITTVVIALPVAFWLRYAAGSRRNLVLLLVTATIFASYLVRIYAWRSMLGQNGVLNSALISIGAIDAPLQFLLFNRFAVTIALVHIFLPYVVLLLYAALGPVSINLLEAAQDLGAGVVRRWTRVVLPLVAAPSATAFIFVFILSASDYVTPQFLGGTKGIMLGVRIQESFLKTGDWPAGAAGALTMLVAFLLLYLLVSFALRLLGLRSLRFVS